MKKKQREELAAEVEAVADGLTDINDELQMEQEDWSEEVSTMIVDNLDEYIQVLTEVRNKLKS